MAGSRRPELWATRARWRHGRRTGEAAAGGGGTRRFRGEWPRHRAVSGWARRWPGAGDRAARRTGLPLARRRADAMSESADFLLRQVTELAGTQPADRHPPDTD